MCVYGMCLLLKIKLFFNILIGLRMLLFKLRD